MTFDDILRQALDETADERAAQMLKIEKKHHFSLAYRLWERKTLRDLRRGHFSEPWTLKKARYAVAAMVSAFSLLIGVTAYAAVVLTGRYGFEDKVDYSKVLIETHPSDKTVIEEYYGLPEEDGWELTDCKYNMFISMLTYRRGDTEIGFVQNIIESGVMGNISTDRAEVEMLSLYEENDGFLLDFGNNETLIYWVYDGYMFHVGGNINKNEAVNLVYSTKVV